MMFMLPDKGKFKYEYQKGMLWSYETLVAPFDFPILKSEAELREERQEISSAVIPVYQLKTDLLTSDEISQTLSDNTDDTIFIASCLELTDSLFRTGIVDEVPDSSYTGGVVEVRNNRHISHRAVSEVIHIEEAYIELLDALYDRHDYTLSQIEAMTSGVSFSPNLIYDDLATRKEVREAVSDIARTKGMIYSGQTIVNQGEVITADTEQLLDSFKAEYEVSVGFLGNSLLLKAGHFFIVTFILLLFSVVLFFLDKSLFMSIRSLSFLLLLMILVTLASVIVMDSGGSYLYIVPYSVIPLYLVSFFGASLVVPLYMVLMLPVVFIAPQGVELYFMNVMAGATAFYTFRYWSRGWLQFINSLFIFVVLSLIYISFRLIEEGSFDSLEGEKFIYFLWNSLLVFAAYPFVFLLEKFFGLVSASRLKDLSDATSSLLSTLAEEAPGTFHHSLQVASLAEAGAGEIGADALLTRVGALYHDIGKMYDPLFFIENVTAGEKNPHRNLSPEKSAEVIIKHVDEGVVLARKYRLPSVVIDFIRTHHGDSQTLYFFNEYVNAGGDPEDLDRFTYDGEKPSTREQVVVMLADSVEAASRSLDDYSVENISELVDKIFEEKRAEGQLDEADITIREVNIVKEVFKLRLGQAYHTRVVYPERNDVTEGE
jgi:putative nucleotidyltransferase with HDIG domain